MGAYIEGRTRFFDRVVVGAIDRGMSQIVVGAAGYDGRALRYGKPGVRWFEVDHPDTQLDKLQRLDQLGIGAGHAQFVAVDFEVDAVDQALIDQGLDPTTPTLFLLEGIIVYLDRAVIEAIFRQLRNVAAAGSGLAVSVSVGDEPELAPRRDVFQAAVAAVGEPVRSHLPPPEADHVLASAGWRVVPLPSDRGGGGGRGPRHAGFLLAEPAVRLGPDARSS